MESISTERPIEIEAAAEVELDIADIVTVGVRGGRRDAQDKARALEERWNQGVAPHLVAAGVMDLAGLDAKMVDAQELDTRIKGKDTELGSLRAQISPLTAAAEALRQASDHAESCRAALGDVAIETLAADLDALGADPLAGLRKRRLELSKSVETARTNTADALKADTVAQERAVNLRSVLDSAVSKRDSALAPFPGGRIIRGHNRRANQAYRRCPERRALESRDCKDRGGESARKINGGYCQARESWRATHRIAKTARCRGSCGVGNQAL